MVRPRAELPDYTPTSVHLSRLLDEAEGERVSVGWLMERLGGRSFGLTLFVMALVALLPGGTIFVGLLIAWPAVQMMLGRDAAVLPRMVARRQVGTARLARIIGIVTPRLRWIERLVRPRWRTPFQTTKRLTGAVTLLLGLTLLSPLPFSQLLPVAVIMLLALAYLEEDGVALAVALIAAAASVAVTGISLWGVVKTIDWLDPAVVA